MGTVEPPVGGQLGPRGRGSISVSNLSRRFKDVEVLKDVDLELGPGEVGALIGPNGSGKTTLLRIIAGILTPHSGAVAVAGRPPGLGLAGYVLAGDRGLYWRLTAMQNMEFFGGIAGLGPTRARANAGEILHILGAESLASRRVEVCSTGQRRRLAIARGFVAGPPVVLVDEPFADLDEQGCRAMEDLTRRWTEMGGSVLYAAPMRGGGPAADLVFDVEQGRAPATTLRSR
jgi:ABC-2 type transport system ATP-binding protein